MFELAREFPVILLTNAPNFRDLGGIRTEDGRRIKHRLLYRSGDLARLSPADIKTMEAIEIRMIIDFRSDREVIKYPTPAIGTVAENKRIPIADSAREEAEIMMAEQNALGLATLLVRDYRRMINDHADNYREFFRVLTTTDQLPLVYHCAAGKDRTGLATYLLLRALGVNDKEARHDYMLSNLHLKDLAEKVIRKVTEKGNNGEILRPMMEVRCEYLDAALKHIDAKFGNLNHFLGHILKADRTSLKKRYLIG
ncbi:MAG: tyrosine-protein phosphatase [bacterium]